MASNEIWTFRTIWFITAIGFALMYECLSVADRDQVLLTLAGTEVTPRTLMPLGVVLAAIGSLTGMAATVGRRGT